MFGSVFPDSDSLRLQRAEALPAPDFGNRDKLCGHILSLRRGGNHGVQRSLSFLRIMHGETVAGGEQIIFRRAFGL